MREAAQRLGVSITAMHKAERTGRIAREPDSQWEITKTHPRLLHVATANVTIDDITGNHARRAAELARACVSGNTVLSREFLFGLEGAGQSSSLPPQQTKALIVPP